MRLIFSFLALTFGFSAAAIEVTRTPIERRVWRRTFTTQSTPARERRARAYLARIDQAVPSTRSAWHLLPGDAQHRLVVHEAIEAEIEAQIAATWTGEDRRPRATRRQRVEIGRVIEHIFEADDEPDADTSRAPRVRAALHDRMMDAARTTAARSPGAVTDEDVDVMADALTRIVTQAARAGRTGNADQAGELVTAALRLITEVHLIAGALEPLGANLLPLPPFANHRRRLAGEAVLRRFWDEVRTQTIDRPRGVVPILTIEPGDVTVTMPASLFRELRLIIDEPDLIGACELLLTIPTERTNQEPSSARAPAHIIAR